MTFFFLHQHALIPIKKSGRTTIEEQLLTLNARRDKMENRERQKKEIEEREKLNVKKMLLG